MEQTNNIEENKSPYVPEEKKVTPQVSLKSSSKLIPILLIILIFAVLGVGALYAYENYFRKEKPIVNPNTNNPITISPTDPTSNWKTYNGALVSYKYPTGLFIRENNQNTQSFYTSSTVAETSENCIKNNLGTMSNPCPYPTLEITISKLNNINQIPTNTTDASLPIYLTYVNSEGLSIVKNKEAIGGMGLSNVLEGFVVKDNITYKINLQTDPAEGTRVNINDWETLNRILSTFKFTNETSVIDISNWKTYSNTKYGYAISYPPNWVYREFPNSKDGAGFRLESEPNDLTYEHVSIIYSARGSDDINIPFDTYVKQAATREIQDYLSLVSISEVKTSSNIIGYKTTWNVQEMGQPSSKTYISLPITYFDTKDSYGGTIQISLEDTNYIDLYNQIISTFKFN